MARFLLLLRSGQYESYSEVEMKSIVQKFMDWSDELRADGIYYDSAPLKSGGRTLSVQDARIVDGPFAETKEAVAGFFMIEAADADAATRIGRNCPHLQYNGIVEVREIDSHVMEPQ